MYKYPLFDALMEAADELQQKSEETPQKSAETPPAPTAEQKPEEKPAEEKPAEQKPVEEKPAEEKPVEVKPAPPVTRKELEAMKTLVLHIVDPTTDFLIPIYDDKGWTVIRHTMKDEELMAEMEKYDRIVMLGHGTSGGLIGWGTYSVNWKFVEILSKKNHNVHIWCNADGYMKDNGLIGFFTGMFISEVREADFMKVKATEEEVKESNELFAQTMRKYINEDSTTMLEKIKAMYISDKNPVIIDNHKRLYYTNVPLPKPPKPVYQPYEWKGSYSDYYGDYESDYPTRYGGGGWGGYSERGGVKRTYYGQSAWSPSAGNKGFKRYDGTYDWEYAYLAYRNWVVHIEGKKTHTNARLIAYDPALGVVTVKTQWEKFTQPTEESYDIEALSKTDKQYVKLLAKEIDKKEPKVYTPGAVAAQSPAYVGGVTSLVKKMGTAGRRLPNGDYSWEHRKLPYRTWQITKQRANPPLISITKARLLSYNPIAGIVELSILDIDSQSKVYSPETELVSYDDLAKFDQEYINDLMMDMEDIEKAKAPLKALGQPPLKQSALPLIHDNMTDDEVEKVAQAYQQQKIIQQQQDKEAARKARIAAQEKAKEDKENEKDQKAFQAFQTITPDMPEEKKNAIRQYYARRMDRKKAREWRKKLVNQYQMKKGGKKSGKSDQPQLRLLPASTPKIPPKVIERMPIIKPKLPPTGGKPSGTRPNPELWEKEEDEGLKFP